MKILKLLYLLICSNLYLQASDIRAIKDLPIDPLMLTRVLTTTDEDKFLDSRPIVISLGDSCQPAINLVYAKLRFMAYPFDWAVARFNDVYDIIKTDFLYCREPEFFADIYDAKFSADRLTNMHYPELLFPHAKRETFFEDLNRRIDRFYKAIHYAQTAEKTIFFIIHSNTFTDISVKESGNKLNDLLTEKFPALDFRLIVMHHANMLPDYFNENKNMYIHLKHAGWTQESYSEWRDKFAVIGLMNVHSAEDTYSHHPF